MEEHKSKTYKPIRLLSIIHKKVVEIEVIEYPLLLNRLRLRETESLDFAFGMAGT